MESKYRLPAGVEVQYDSTPPAKSQNAAATHQRTYQACIPCRRRKVRCDLGSVDNPGDPPCVRCRRESKECYFSSTRRKKKNADGTEIHTDSEEEHELKGRKRIKISAGADDEPSIIYDADRPRTPGGSVGQAQPLRRPTGPRAVQYGEEDQKASEQTVGLLQAAEVHGGHDALKLLYEAASVHGRKGSNKDVGVRPGSLNGVSPASGPAVASPIAEKMNGSYTQGPMAMYQNDPMWKANVHPTSNPVDNPAVRDPVGYASALKAWSRFRWVRAGWFTAKEAIDYIDYFHKHLAPLTPVALPDFRSLDSHETLLTQEPMLSITMLLIASRHMKLEGPGSVSRPYSIHQKLWSYLSGMIQRLLWGQEQFGGGFCGAGAEPGCDVNPLSRKGLRTLGTVESLVLLTEWHPRAMHFPPDEADEELMIPDERLATPDITETNGDAPKGIGGQRMESWLEPCWRSDRMCWMLLGLSMSLAFEIGVFDSGEWQRRYVDGQPVSSDLLQSYDRRRSSVRDILLIYVTQTSGRLGLTSMLPTAYSKPEDSALFSRDIASHQSVQETVLHFSLRMAAILREGNQKIFANKSFTRDLIRNGNYEAVLEQFQPTLQTWRKDFDNCQRIPKYMRHILEIEYEYCRVYINALALQAIAERCANQNFHQNKDAPPGLARTTVATNGVRTDMAIPPQTLAKALGGDRHYMLQVGDAARNLLKVVVDGLYPGQYLRHAPVRTYFRIISVSIMLLKSFSLGASESDVSDSLSLMDRTVEALRGCIVDDVHVASRFADLLDTLTQNLKPRLVRITADGRPSTKSHRASNRGSPEPAQSSYGATAQKPQMHRQRNDGASLPSQQQWSYNNGNMPPVSNAMTLNNPLDGISSDAYNLLDPDNVHSIMPPPSFAFQSPNSNKLDNNSNMNTSPGGTYGPYFGADALSEDWFALPLNPIIGMNGNGAGDEGWVDVNQTMYGPELGGQDMLELLLGPGNAGGF